ELGGDVIVVLRDLTFVAEINPYRAEDMRHLGSEDRRVGVDQPVNAVFLNEFVPVIEVGRFGGSDRWGVELFKHVHVPLPCEPARRYSAKPAWHQPGQVSVS